MLGYATTLLLSGLLKVALIVGIAYMAAPAHRARKENVEWTPETAKRRKIVWIILIVSALFIFNGALA